MWEHVILSTLSLPSCAPSQAVLVSEQAHYAFHVHTHEQRASPDSAHAGTAHLVLIAKRAIRRDVSQVQSGVIPGHVGVIPRYPGQLFSIRAKPWGCYKVAAPC